MCWDSSLKGIDYKNCSIPGTENDVFAFGNIIW